MDMSFDCGVGWIMEDKVVCIEWCQKMRWNGLEKNETQVGKQLVKGKTVLSLWYLGTVFLKININITCITKTFIDAAFNEQRWEIDGINCVYGIRKLTMEINRWTGNFTVMPT